jgi:hypothetical protein
VNPVKLFFFIFGILFSCHPGSENNKEPTGRELKASVKTFMNDTGLAGWGYEIYILDSLYIHQKNIPAVQGNKGFKSEKDALIAGKFVVYKIKNKIIPPTVSVRELDSLGVLK